MRILLGTLYPNLGGSTRVLLAAAEALASEHEVVVRAPLREATHRSPPAMPVEPLAGPAAKVMALPHLSAAIAREFAFIRRVRPDVLYVHDEPALYVYGAVSRLVGIPLVWHVHMAPGGGFKGRARRALSDRRIFISRFTAAAMPGSPEAPAVIRNPILSVPPPPPPPPRPGPENGSLSLTVVGAIGARKNQALALETLAILLRRGREARLTLIGPEIEPAYARALRDRASALGIAERVRFAGALRPDEVWRDEAVVLFPSTYENQPLALVEALAGGRRLVAADILAHREILEDIGADPRVLCPHDPVAFADAVERASGATPGFVQVERVRALFAPERFASAIRDLFRELDAGSRR